MKVMNVQIEDQASYKVAKTQCSAYINSENSTFMMLGNGKATVLWWFIESFAMIKWKSGLVLHQSFTKESKKEKWYGEVICSLYLTTLAGPHVNYSRQDYLILRMEVKNMWLDRYKVISSDFWRENFFLFYLSPSFNDRKTLTL